MHLPVHGRYLQLRPRFAVKALGSGLYSATLLLPCNSPVLMVESDGCFKGARAVQHGGEQRRLQKCARTLRCAAAGCAACSRELQQNTHACAPTAQLLCIKVAAFLMNVGGGVGVWG